MLEWTAGSSLSGPESSGPVRGGYWGGTAHGQDPDEGADRQG